MTHKMHPSDEQLSQKPDDVIDRALHSLRAAQPPTGLEARIAARLAQAAEAPTAASRFPFLAVILSTAKTPRTLLAPVPLYTLAATFLMTVSFFAFHHHPNTATIDHSATQPLAPSNQPSSPAQTPTVATTRVPQGLNPVNTHALQAFSVATTLVPQGFSLGSHRIQKEEGALAPAASPDPDALALAETLAPTVATTLVPQGLSPANTHALQAFSVATTLVPQGFSLGSHRIQKEEGALAPAASPNTLALAETQAPSHPAPTMPLTAQEHLLLTATRQGQPIELAALDTLRQPALQAAAEARQRERIRRYAQSLLGPLAAAEALNSTSPPLPDEVSTALPPSSK